VRFEAFDRLGESSFAGLAAPALHFALAVGSKLLAAFVLALEARHGLFSACAEREKPYNEIASGVRLTPRSGLALPSARTPDRAAFCYLSNWWRSAHGLLLSVTGPWILLGATPANHGPFADLPAKSFPPVALQNFVQIPDLLARSFLYPGCRVGREECLVVAIGGLPISGHTFGKSVATFNQSCQGGVQHRERIGISAYIDPHISEALHNVACCEPHTRLRHQNLSAQVGKASGRCNAVIIGQRSKRSDCLFELSNSLSEERQLGLSLLQFLLGGQVA